TNSIAQGDTREAGLAPLVQQGRQIAWARTNLAWPGAAKVVVSIVVLTKGIVADPANQAGLRLNGELVAVINSRLEARPERAAPVKLQCNGGLSYKGVYHLGDGFILSEDERSGFLERDTRNA